MSRTVFILGAGASKAAGAPLMNEFLDVADELRRSRGLGQEAANFELVFRGMTELEAVQSRSRIDLMNVEHVFAAFEMAGLLGKLGSMEASEVEGLEGAMRRVIGLTLERRMAYPGRAEDRVGPPAPYEEFAALMREISSADSAAVSVITFNYDVALDYAFHWHRIGIDYCLGSDRDPGGTEVMKLHGSLNWARCSQCRSVIPWYIKDFFSKR